VGTGGRGEITERVQKAFFEITKGEREAPGDWLTYVKAAESVRPSNNGYAAEKLADVRRSANRGAEPAGKYQTAASAID
jgi:hypothetical protein